MANRTALKPTKKSENTKRMLHQTAMRLIDQLGYEEATIQRICRECGVSVGTFYNYYDSKEAIVTEVSKKNDELYDQIVRNGLTETDTESYIRAYFRYYADLNVQAGTNLYTRTTRKKTIDMRQEQIRPMYTILEEFLRERQKEHIVRDDMHAVTMVHQLFTVVRAVVLDWCICDGKYDLHREVQDFLTPYIQYILTVNKTGAGESAEEKARAARSS